MAADEVLEMGVIFEPLVVFFNRESLVPVILSVINRRRRRIKMNNYWKNKREKESWGFRKDN